MMAKEAAVGRMLPAFLPMVPELAVEEAAGRALHQVGAQERDYEMECARAAVWSVVGGGAMEMELEEVEVAAGAMDHGTRCVELPALQA